MWYMYQILGCLQKYSASHKFLKKTERHISTFNLAAMALSHFCLNSLCPSFRPLPRWASMLRNLLSFLRAAYPNSRDSSPTSVIIQCNSTHIGSPSFCSIVNTSKRRFNIFHNIITKAVCLWDGLLAVYLALRRPIWETIWLKCDATMTQALMSPWVSG